MMHRIIILILIINLFSSKTAMSQEINHCDSVLQHAARNYVNTLSFDQQKAYVYSRACRGQYRNSTGSTKLSIEAVIESIPLGIGFGSSNSKQVVDQWCEKNQNYDQSVNLFSQQQSIVFGPAVAAWLSCKEAYKSGLKVETQIAGGSRTIDMHVTNESPTSDVILRGVHVESEGNSIGCMLITDEASSVADASTRTPLLPQQAVNINCRRSEISVDRDGQPVSILPGGSITVSTKLRNYQLSIPEESVIQLTDKKAESIMTELNNLKIREIGDIQCRWTGWKNKFDLQIERVCGKGEYINGMSWKHNVHENYTYQESVNAKCCRFQ